MAVTVYKSTDGSAPVLTGSVGDLINLLAKCLVDGYGAKSPAGWTKPYTSTNAAVFKQGTGSSGFYYQVNDNGPGAGGAKEARIVGYETMSAYGTGTNLFPTAAQKANGLFIRKSASADATARAWCCVADAATAYLFIVAGDGYTWGYMLGDIYSYLANDAYRAALIARGTENSATNTVDEMDRMEASWGVANGNIYCARAHEGAPGAFKHGTNAAASVLVNTSMVGQVQYPNGADGGIYTSEILFTGSLASSLTLRGHHRGLKALAHAAGTVANYDTWTGTGEEATNTFMAITLAPRGGTWAVRTNNWDSN